MTDGSERSPTPGSPTKRRRSTDGASSSPNKRPKHHDRRHEAVDRDIIEDGEILDHAGNKILTDVGHKSQRSEGMKDKSFTEEGKEKHQEKTEHVQKIDVPQNVEKARTRKITIVMKCRQHEKEPQQRQVKPVPCINTEEVKAMDADKSGHVKIDNCSSSVTNVQAEHGSSEVSSKKADLTVGKLRRNKILVSTSGPSNQIERAAVTGCGDSSRGPPAATRKPSKDGGSHIQRNDHHDNWDDVEGYYSYRCGELLNGRYEIQSQLGKGVFSTVVRAKDLQAGKDDPEQVAIKIVRNNDTMNRAGKEEVSILRKLAGADGKDRHHCVKFISSFRYHNHLCLVFESLDMNLRQALKKFTCNTGFDLTTVRASSKQLFIALKHLKNCKVLHCDIKPDNILVDDTKKMLKLCDFGSAMLAGMNEVTPYLVSRFYRAPEIMLGLPYDHPLDMWSVGCCIYELHTGKVLFPGESNNDMLRLHMELKGSLPKKMLRKGAFTTQHFNRDLNFQAVEEDPVTTKVSRRLILNIKPKGVGSLISNIRSEDPKVLSSFKDLLDKIFVLDPEKRITVEQALSHPFITGKSK